jgi:hypothetical protein
MGLDVRALAMRDAWMRIMTLFFRLVLNQEGNSLACIPFLLCKSPLKTSIPPVLCSPAIALHSSAVWLIDER